MLAVAAAAETPPAEVAVAASVRPSVLPTLSVLAPINEALREQVVVAARERLIALGYDFVDGGLRAERGSTTSTPAFSRALDNFAIAWNASGRQPLLPGAGLLDDATALALFSAAAPAASGSGSSRWLLGLVGAVGLVWLGSRVLAGGLRREVR